SAAGILKITVNASAAGNTSNVHVCFHRNSSLAVGMCADYEWEEVTDGLWTATMSPFDHKLLDVRVANSSSNVTDGLWNATMSPFGHKLLDVRVANSSNVTDGLWNATMSPFGHKLLDVRVANSSSNVTLQVSTLEGSCMYRIYYLIVGTVLMTWASTLSTSYAFYFACCFSVGGVLFILLLLFQGIKRLPTRPSFSALFLYASLLALTYVSLPYIPGFFQGVDEFEFLHLFGVLQMVGVPFALLALNTQLLLAPDDSIDMSTSLFISWSLRILAALLILQGSGDALLGGGAVVFVIAMSPVSRKITALIFPPRARETIPHDRSRKEDSVSNEH
ncbi:unnamed protein product, partial [Thlaspi arvense]